MDEHSNYYTYDHREKPQIAVIKTLAGQIKETTVTESEIIFFIDGKMSFSFNDLPDY